MPFFIIAQRRAQKGGPGSGPQTHNGRATPYVWAGGKPHQDDRFEENARKIGAPIQEDTAIDRDYIVLPRPVILYHATTKDAEESIRGGGIRPSTDDGNVSGVYLGGPEMNEWHGAENTALVRVSVPAGERLYRDHQPNAVFVRKPVPISWIQSSDKGGPGSGPQTHNGRAKPPAVSARSERARAAHFMVDSEIQRYAEEYNEPIIAKALGGKSSRNSAEVDIILTTSDGRQHGVELKTMVANGNAKITMKTQAMQRKKSWERKNKGTVHTVVLDDSKVFNALGKGKHDITKRRILYRRGYGSFRTAKMHVCANMAEVKRLIQMPKRELPVGAKSEEPEDTK